MIKEYNRDLHDFECKTKLKDFIGNYNRPTPPDYKEVELKLGDNWREKTLADVKLINLQISRRSWLMKMGSQRLLVISHSRNYYIFIVVIFGLMVHNGLTTISGVRSFSLLD